MKQEVPFVELFAALSQWQELVNATEKWQVVQAKFDRKSRSAEVELHGAQGAGANLLDQVQQALCRCYGFVAVKLVPLEEKKEEKKQETQPQPQPKPPVQRKEQDPFARTQAIREEAIAKLKKNAPPPKKPLPQSTIQREIIYGKSMKRPIYPMSQLSLEMGLMGIQGDVFAVDHRELKKNGAWVLSFDMTDYTGSVHVSKYLKGEDAKEVASAIRTGKHLVVHGKLVFDRYYGDNVFDPISIQTGEREVRMDNAPQKRVELHMHTTYSTMDALSPVGEKLGPEKNIIKRAEQWGHPAIAVTDHGTAHAFPEAWHSAKKIQVLYGTEAYFMNDVDDRVVVHGQVSQPLEDEIVCFDLETTGLDKRREVIIEIGAVVLKNGEITERFQTFVQPDRPLSMEIVKLTSITDEMLQDAPSQQEALEQFLRFVGNRPLAAHNAEFDMGFLAEGCKRYGLPLENASLDSLILAQNLLPELGKYKLNLVAEHLGLPDFHHHRADDDAATVAYMLPHFWKKLHAIGVERLEEINAAMPKLRQKGANTKGKRQPRHIIVLAKNQTGLRNLYRLISKAHLEHFKRYPTMPKSLINEHREGLILGSACEAGELFSAVAKHKDWAELKRIASWYDYLEIQPLCNNYFMIRKGLARDEEELKDFNRTIVRLGEELGKPVCATGDVHFLDPQDEIYRHILLASKGFDDADQPLPIYFKTTEEMLQEFSYLGEEKAFEVVVTNTNLVASWCDPIPPLPKGLFAPKLENSDEELKELVWNKAHELYGEQPPQIVVDRINVELGDIIGCKYDVIYMSAQKLVQNSLENGYLVGSRGSVGSSLVAFLSGITEVNSLPAHYRCPNCKHSDFEYGQDPKHPYGCGADMPDQNCPICGTPYQKDGFNIPFETFLGFGGDKVPDIDLNFSGEYQANAHKYTFELFGQDHVFRAGTVGTVAEKTAYGYVKKYLQERGLTASKAEENRLTMGCTGVKRTTGQHPGGMVVIPQDKEIAEFCPVQHPADDTNTDIITTHFEYHAMESNLLKLDILGHDDPTMIRMLEDLTGVNARTEIALDDPKTMSIFKSSKVLGYEHDPILGPTGGTAIPEFGTTFVRGMLEDTRPEQFDTLIRLSGFSHGTDVWLGNAKDLITNGVAEVNEAIGCRDDIMIFLISKGLEPKYAFKIMESVRKGKGLPDGAEKEMHKHGVPDWYINSCKKIAYLFPKAHAVAYVMMAFRIAWFKVHKPLAFYAAYFSIRAKAFDEAYMCRGMEVCQQKMAEIKAKDKEATAVEQSMLTTLEVCYEFYLRGFTFQHLDLYQSDAILFRMDEEHKALIPPFISVAGLGESAAISLVEQRKDRHFISIEEVANTCKVSSTHIELLKAAGAFGNMPETSQMDLFSMFG